jgi:hypothetical protein
MGCFQERWRLRQEAHEIIAMIVAENENYIPWSSRGIIG